MENGSAGGGRPQITQGIVRGVVRLLASLDAVAVTEVPLGNGRRADIVALDRRGVICIIEVKSSMADFLADRKWQAYLDYCDDFSFAVGPAFPLDALPQEPGIIVADAYGGAVVRAAPRRSLAGARRKAMTLAVARAAALRLAHMLDRDLPLAPRGLPDL